MRNGTKFNYKQVVETDDFFLYKVNNNYYELFKKKIVNKADYVEGKIIKIDELKEKYPSDNDFGSWAFHCQNLNVVKRLLKEKFNMRDEDINECLYDAF